MKNRLKILSAAALVFFTLSIASCALTKKILPPGQAKKILGQQNASQLAPGNK